MCLFSGELKAEYLALLPFPHNNLVRKVSLRDSGRPKVTHSRVKLYLLIFTPTLLSCDQSRDTTHEKWIKMESPHERDRHTTALCLCSEKERKMNPDDLQLIGRHYGTSVLLWTSFKTDLTSHHSVDLFQLTSRTSIILNYANAALNHSRALKRVQDVIDSSPKRRGESSERTQWGSHSTDDLFHFLDWGWKQPYEKQLFKRKLTMYKDWQLILIANC